MEINSYSRGTDFVAWSGWPGLAMRGSVAYGMARLGIKFKHDLHESRN